ncbi:MAG TPA: pyridoxal 5'-phosphate synthase glutaminase subunit PdxT, partial [Planctomycetota bacterium]
MSAAPRVGVLALQGASAPHLAAFARLALAARPVRAPADLDGLTHLVLPGGESTTLHHLLTLFGL